ncbi:Transcription factor bHLH30 [Mucuna pruriens]|uniref:Transcription factor bHLH30 n=1 Tax=Mucuna pruriens TaxID=157652 RepID=A0A371F2T7_MUCPR|nr:Transcription factor bHLH30 [Mucuna pruriens]
MEMEAFVWGDGIDGDAPMRSSDGFEGNNGVIGSGCGSSFSLVLDRERGELVEAPVKLERKGVSTERSIQALKSHSEAERRRRARINSHLDTLRSVIPGANKMDKAALLGEVIRHLKELKKNAAQACEGLMIPKDNDEISVEEQEGGLNGFPYSIRASLCCEYKPGLLSDIRQALDALHLMITRADIATLEGRMKNVFVIISCKEQNFEDAAYRQFLAGSVHQALRSVLNRFSVSQDILGTRKRRRISIFSSSSLDDFLFECETQRNSENMALSSPLQNLSAVISASGNAAVTARPPRWRHWAVNAAASDTSTGASVQLGGYEEGKLERPKWAGETPLSRLVKALISFKPFYSLLKIGARRALISTAEKNNIPWRAMAKEILESEVYGEMDTIQNKSLVYPDYYLNPFHAYDEGNLTWLAAAEAEAATMSMARRALPDASSIQEANQILRGNWLRAIEQHHIQYSKSSRIDDILDIGCSVGISTGYLADKFPTAKVTGLDLSPYFLAVAQHKEKRAVPRNLPIRWIHANGEDTGLPSKSFDLVSFAFVLHECPTRVIVNLAREAFRLLRPGGTLALIDFSLKSKVLQELSPVLFTLVKSTEPFLDEYYLTDLDETLREAGFVNITSILTDPRHVTITATVPQ